MLPKPLAADALLAQQCLAVINQTMYKAKLKTPMHTLLTKHNHATNTCAHTAVHSLSQKKQGRPSCHSHAGMQMPR
jgi:hypothetical protein